MPTHAAIQIKNTALISCDTWKTQPRRIKRYGFTLIELLVSTVIILTIASIVTPSFFSSTETTKIAAANTILRNVQKKIEEYRILQGHWPTEIDVHWFTNHQYPTSPFAPDYVGKTININDSPAKWHPGFKTLDRYPPFWYCRGNGSFRIRVPRQATDADTIKLYNAANMSRVTRMGDQSY